MSTTFLPILAARKELATRRFRSTNEKAIKYNEDNLRRTRDASQFGDAGKKREAAELWLDYIAEGMTIDAASQTLRENRIELGFSANDVETGIWHARDSLRLGYARTIHDRREVQLLLPYEQLSRVIDVLDLRPHVLSDGFVGGYASRGVWATYAEEGLVVDLDEADPRRPRLEELVA